MSDPPLLRVSGICKQFGSPVLRDLELTLMRGEVHALVGSNGAGKSTLSRILAGLLRADCGRMELEGQPYDPASRRQAECSGVTLMLQELNLFASLTVAENLFLHCLPNRFGIVDQRKLREQAIRALRRVGLDTVDPDSPAAGLGLGQQQLVELARALDGSCRLLILDEPTAALTPHETQLLFAQVERLRSSGVCIVYISHRMDELQRIADRVSVLRDGQRVATLTMGETSAAELIRLMAGHDVRTTPAPGQRQPGPVRLRVTGLSNPPAVRDVSFEVRAGEILGLSGLVGAGRTETLRAIFGADPLHSGHMELNGRAFAPTVPADAVARGCALVPEDRKLQGLLLPESVRVNSTLATLGRWLTNRRREQQQTDSVIHRLDVRCSSGEQTVGTLSGGNQQKVMMGRWLLRDSGVLLLDEPTRGVDAAAREQIHAVIRELANEGRAVVVVSGELPELMSLCDRIAVMSTGTIVRTLQPEEWTSELLTEAAFQGHRSLPDASFPERFASAARSTGTTSDDE